MSTPNETTLTNGCLEWEPMTTEELMAKLQEAHSKLKAISEENVRLVGEALYNSGFRVICDPTLHDSEIKVSPAIHHAALMAHVNRVTHPTPNEAEPQP